MPVDAPVGLFEHPDGQRDHADPHHRSREIRSLADDFHTVAEHQQLHRPEHHEGDPAQRALPEETTGGPRFHARPNAHDQHDHRQRCQVGLDAVPEYRDQSAQQGGDVGAEDAEGGAGEHRERYAHLLPGDTDQVGAQPESEHADEQREHRLPPGQAQGEHADGEGVATRLCAEVIHRQNRSHERQVALPSAVGARSALSSAERSGVC